MPDAAHEGLRLERVRAGYNRATVLRGITLHAAPGECVAVLGPNGVGKTTTMRAIGGVVRPTAGEIWWRGARLDGLPPHRVVRRGVATVPEGRRLYGGMSVEENLLMGAYTERRGVAAGRLARMLETFPLLAARRRQLAGSMSGGQQQLCAIARALMSDPELVLIDELSLGLSPAAIEEVLEALRRAMELFRPTVLLVDQDVNVAAALATRGYFLDLGAVVASGPMSDLVEVDLIKDLYFRKERKVAV